MATRAQIDKLSARIEALGAAISPAIEGCILTIPDAWLDGELEARVWERHCATYPMDRTAKQVVWIKEWLAPDPPSHYVDRYRYGQHTGSPSVLLPNGWRLCDDESWREVARGLA